MRIDKLLANSGWGSRKEVKKILKSGAVLVDGVKVTDSKKHVDPDNMLVTVDGERVEYKESIYILMNKPGGYISATEDNHLETVIDLLQPEDAQYEPFPVGRLDRDTEGLLLLTNDGKLAHDLLSPIKHVQKTYFANIDGVVTEEDSIAFRQGVVLNDGYKTKPAQLTIIKSDLQSEIELTITEGKFHQVKRMFEAVGKKVTYLQRISMGRLTLDDALGLGQYRELTTEEIESLKQK